MISTKLATYVKNRDTFAGGNAAKLTEYQTNKKNDFTKAMNAMNYVYGKAAHDRYLRVIDLAISTAFYSDINSGQTNAFNTLMQQWYSASSRSAIFEQIKPLLFNFLYTTNNTVYPNTVFPLKVDYDNNVSEYIAWFGAPITPVIDVKRNGFLYNIIKDGWQFVKDAYNSNSGIPFTAYALLNDADGPLTQDTIPLSQLTLPPSLVVFSTGLVAAMAEEVNMSVVAVAKQVETSVSSLSYTIVGIGYDSLATAEASAIVKGTNVSTLGFKDITGAGANNLDFKITTANNNSLYTFKRDNAWYHGYQQSSSLINSWVKLSPAQNVVMFYAGTGENALAPNLAASQSSVTALCDDVKFVMIIEAVAGSTTKSVSLYTYDVMGLESGELVAVGKLVGGNANAAPVPTIYSVIGAFQKDGFNSNINLVGDLVIPNDIKNIGINAFANSSQVKSLFFGAGDSGVSVGSNAFQTCTALSSINLGSTIRSIGPSAFLKCSGANSLVLPPSNFSVINHWSFIGCSNLGKNGNLALPVSLQQINVQAFARCPFLTCSQLNGGSGFIPQNLQKIGMGAFLGCTGLTGALDFNNVNNAGSYESSIEFIGGAAFMGCTGLNGSLALPINPKYTNVLPYVFSSMDAPIIKNSGAPMGIPTPSDIPMALIGAVDVARTKITTIETCAFYKCSALSSMTLSNLVTKIGVKSFFNCSSLGGVLNVPASVLNVGVEAFMGCSTLGGLNIVSATVSQDDAGSGTTLGLRCFKNCTSLVGSTATAGSGLIIPNNVIRMEDNAFEGCVSIEALAVGSGFTKAGSFGANLFSGCTKLARVVLAFSFLSRDVAGQSVIKNATLPAPQFNSSFTGCTALGVVPNLTTTGTVQIQSGATGWTAGRAAFFNQLTIVVNNKNITFYLKEFNKNISVVDPSKEAVQLEALPVTDAQAVVYVKASEMRKVFQVSTDSYITTGAQNEGATSDTGKLFFVRPDTFPQYLNVANAHVVQGGIESYNSKPYEQLVKDDVMRYYATSLFNSADWVTMFSNDVEMMENMVASSGLMPIVPNGDTDASGKNLINEGVLNN